MLKNILKSLFCSLLSATAAWAESAAPVLMPPPAPQPVQGMPEAKFISAVQWAVNESSPELTKRSQAILVKEFSNSLEAWPELQGTSFDVHTSGNELVFYFTTPQDMRVPIQGVVSAVVTQVREKFPSRGRALFYRAALEEMDPSAGFLEVVGDPEKKKILSITAQAVPLRDLLKEIKNRLRGESLSYLIPGQCADRLVDWNFGAPGTSLGKDSETVIGELAAAFDLPYEKRNGTYIFKASCPDHFPRRQVPLAEMVRTQLTPDSMAARRSQVVMPVLPIGY